MSELISFKLADGQDVGIEVAEQQFYGEQTISAEDQQVPKSFEEAIAKIKPAAEIVLKQLTDLAQSPDRVDIEFGIKLSAKAGAIIASASSEANFTIKLGWSKPS